MSPSVSESLEFFSVSNTETDIKYFFLHPALLILGSLCKSMAEEYHEEHEGHKETEKIKPCFVLFVYFVVNNRT